MSQVLPLHFDPKLVEEAVFFAQRNRRIGGALVERRNQIYEVTDADEREELFRELYHSWLERLGLGNIVRQAIGEQALIHTLVSDCYVVCAAQAKQEGAELFVNSDDSKKAPRRTLRILLRPESLLTSESTLTFLRHELFHIADMLDPAFAYEPNLPQSEGGPTYDTLIINRYRVLWDITIAGRMLRLGWCDASVRPQQLGDFLRAFPMLQDKSETLFGKFFDNDEPHHSELTAFSFDPRKACDALIRQAAPGTHCPLCKFPTHSFEQQPEALGAQVLQSIAVDFPNWDVSQGLCVQCAELYRARQISMAALRALPGWNHAQF